MKKCAKDPNFILVQAFFCTRNEPVGNWHLELAIKWLPGFTRLRHNFGGLGRLKTKHHSAVDLARRTKCPSPACAMASSASRRFASELFSISTHWQSVRNLVKSHEISSEITAVPLLPWLFRGPRSDLTRVTKWVWKKLLQRCIQLLTGRPVWKWHPKKWCDSCLHHPYRAPFRGHLQTPIASKCFEDTQERIFIKFQVSRFSGFPILRRHRFLLLGCSISLWICSLFDVTDLFLWV